MSEQKQLNKVGIYLRLSKDDEKLSESLSINNQRLILQNFVSAHSGTIIDEYVDDGYSGTNFNRPAVKRLLEDAQVGKIDTIIVKDLSRFGRNYIQVGQYTDYIFPSYGIRFIALNDNIDTSDRNSSGMDMMPILNVFNEWHAANTSKKNKAVFEAKARAGKYQAWRAPYGYVIGNDKNRLPVVDEPAASVVRRIFQMRACGTSPNKIAQALNKGNIPNPTDYRLQKFGVMGKQGSKHFWSPEPIREILSNPIYTGDLVQRRETTVSYKNKKHLFRPESEWITVPNTHEAIISRELWQKVKEVSRSVSRGKSTEEGIVLPLSGLMYCADCGSKMQYKRSKKALVNVTGDKPYYVCERYICGAYSRIGECCCSSHVIHRKVIENTILEDLRSKMNIVLDDEQKAREEFLRQKQRINNSLKADDGKKQKEKQKRLTELDKMIKSLYEDKVCGKIDEAICFELLSQYQDERKTLQAEIATLEERQKESRQDEYDVDEFIRRIKHYSSLNELTREMCLQLIEYITIDKFEKNSNVPRQIHIYYKLLDKPTKKERS